MAIFRGGKRVGPFDIRIGLPRGREYDNIPGDPRLKQRANPETTLNRFRSAIAKAEGVARNTRFLVNINLPKNDVLTAALRDRQIATSNPTEPGPGPAGQTTSNKTAKLQYERDLGQQITLMCTNITMPARTFTTAPYRIAGAPYKYPTSVQYSDVTATFIGDKFLRLRQFFEVWQSTMYDNLNGMFNFYEEYVSDIAIFQLDDQDVAVYGCRLEDCYVGDLGAIEYSNASTGVVRQPVTMQFRRWSNIALDSQPSTSVSQAGNEVPNRAPTRRTTFNLGVKIKL